MGRGFREETKMNPGDTLPNTIKINGICSASLYFDSITEQ
jgi:hypothetical protein